MLTAPAIVANPLQKVLYSSYLLNVTNWFTIIPLPSWFPRLFLWKQILQFASALCEKASLCCFLMHPKIRKKVRKGTNKLKNAFSMCILLWKLIKTNKQIVSGKNIIMRKDPFSTLFWVCSQSSICWIQKEPWCFCPAWTRYSWVFFWRKKRFYLCKVDRVVATYYLSIDTTAPRSL